MADSFKVSIDAVYSEEADYTDEEWSIDEGVWDAYEIEPTEKWGPSKVSAATGGTTLTPGGYLTTSCVMILKNTDATNYVQVGWTDVSTTACVARVPAGGILVVPLVNPGTTVVLTANSAAVVCKVAFIQTA
jgi:hypothetical protein